jgi:hypothetical protein
MEKMMYELTDKQLKALIDWAFNLKGNMSEYEYKRLRNMKMDKFEVKA